MIYIDFYNTFTHNAWRFTGIENNLRIYTAIFMIKNNAKVYAYVSEDSYSIDFDGYVGVSFLRAEYENEDGSMDLPWEDGEIEGLLSSMDYAEENLLKIGVPFTSDYEFHGNNKEEKKKRNEALKKKLNIEAYEKECWEECLEREEEERKKRESEKEKLR